MLTHDRLLELYRELAKTPVLSVYIDGSQDDPAARKQWRTQLNHGLDEARRGLRAEAQEAQGSFEAAAKLVQKELDGLDGFLPGKAFVAFATAGRLWYAETVSVSMPDLVRWDLGPAVSPYVRGLKQERPVVVALLDSRRARVFLYRDGGVHELEDLRADTFVGDLTDTGHQQTQHGEHQLGGETGKDAAHRFLHVASERMVKELAKIITQHAGDHGFVVLGGTPEMENWARGSLPKSLEDRVLIEPSLHVEMRDAEVRQAVGDAASDLTERWQEGLVGTVFDQAGAHAHGAMGDRDTEQALEEMRVDALLLSRTRMQHDPRDADRLIGMAFAGGARVEEVSGAAGERLDREAHGIAARLRFRVKEAPATTGTAD